jgi:hypothetical protein
MTKSFDQAAQEAAAAVAVLVASKQRDYGPDNILKCPVGAELGIVVRLYDKLARLAHLIQSGQVPENEALQDTWNDIMGYGLVGKMVNNGTFTLPLEQKK